MTTLTRKQFLEQRRQGIGGSDVGAIVGISPWSTPLDVYNEKLGIADDEETDAFHWGNMLEDVIAQEFSRKTGLKVQRRNTMYRHANHKELIANIDRYIVGERAILEAKTCNAFAKHEWGESGTDQVPFQYLTQCQHYMLVTGLRKCFLAVLIGGNDFRIYNIPYNERLAQSLMDKSIQFWHEHVVPELPPPPMTEADVKLVYSKGDLNPVVADNDVLELVNQLNELKPKVKEQQKKIDELKLGIKLYMGDSSVLLDNEGKQLVTWKAHKSTRLDAKAFKILEPVRYDEFCIEENKRTFLTK